MKTICAVFTAALLLLPAYAFSGNVSVSGSPSPDGVPDETSKSSVEDQRNVPMLDACLLAYGNTKDFYLGADCAYLIHEPAMLYLNAVFYGRPFAKSYFEEVGPHTYYQYKENRFFIGAGLEEIYRFTPSFGLYACADIALSFSVYGGSDTSGESYAAPLLGGGVIFTVGHVTFRGGYQYLPAPQSPDHFIGGGIGANF